MYQSRWPLLDWFASNILMSTDPTCRCSVFQSDCCCLPHVKTICYGSQIKLSNNYSFVFLVNHLATHCLCIVIEQWQQPTLLQHTAVHRARTINDSCTNHWSAGVLVTSSWLVEPTIVDKLANCVTCSTNRDSRTRTASTSVICHILLS